MELSMVNSSDFQLLKKQVSDLISLTFTGNISHFSIFSHGLPCLLPPFGWDGKIRPRTRCPEDPRVTFSITDDGSQHDFFTWQPPKGSMGISSFAKRFQAKPRTFWTKNGLLGE